MTKTYLVALNDGVKFKTTNLDLKSIKSDLESRATHAVKMNRKGVKKNLVIHVADENTKNPTDKNLIVTVADEVFYLKVDDIDKAIDSVINDVNTKPWVEIGGELLFEKNAFRYVEEYIKPE